MVSTKPGKLVAGLIVVWAMCDCEGAEAGLAELQSDLELQVEESEGRGDDEEARKWSENACELEMQSLP